MPLISTPDTSSSVGSAEGESPKKSTLKFIMQFARCYTFESVTVPALGGIIIN